jgi:NhaA family Na+:H+ antiporter
VTTEASVKESPVLAIRATIQEFLQLESAGGIILLAVAVLAMIIANSPLAGLYNAFLEVPLQIRIGELNIEKPLILWINDGLMAIFFLLVGLEVKREILEGQLSDRAQVMLPAIAALGGMAIPALFYVVLNWNNPVAINGWAIPAATDIAFALGILSLFSNRAPATLKLFLLTIAIFDDLGAIVIIAIFYTADLSLFALSLALAAVIVSFVVNRLGITRIATYVVLGIILWVAVLKSGVHATLAGVAVAFAIPLRAKNEEGQSPLHQLEHGLHPWVAYGILPLFAFANAGVSLAGVSLDTLLKPVPLGIIAGLFIGKQLGIFGFSWLTIKLGLAKLPQGSSWLDIYGVAALCGVGFTMSLFIISLAFEHIGPMSAEADQLGILAGRLGILIGSLLSGLWGYLIIRYVVGRRATTSESV